MNEIENKKIDLITFTTPEFTYIPFKDIKNLKIPRNKYLYCHQNTGESVFSSTSGEVIGIKNISTINNESNSLVLLNDYKDEPSEFKGAKKDLYKYSKDEVRSLLNAYKLNKEFLSKKDLIVYINSNASTSLEIGENVHNFLELADFLTSTYKLEKCIFLIHKKAYKSKDFLSMYIGSYLNMEINETKKSYSEIVKKYNKSVIYDSFEFIELYNSLKYNKSTKEKHITLNLKKEIKILKIKIYVSLEELLKFLRVKTTVSKIVIKSNSKEITVENTDFVITKEIEEIILS